MRRVRDVSTRTARRTAIAASLALLLAPGLAACGAGSGSTAASIVSPGDGVLATIGALRIQNVVVVAPANPGGTAVVSMAIANDGTDTDQLVDLSVQDGSTAKLSGSQQISPGASVRYGATDAPAHAYIGSFMPPAGSTTVLTMRFANAGEVVVKPPVAGATGYYSTFLAPGQPSPSPTFSPTVQPSSTSSPAS
jgi:hypothetical protein